MTNARDNTVKSASRAFDVLEFVAGSTAAPAFNELCKALDIPKSSMSNLLSTLVERGYLQFCDERKTRYKLGPVVQDLARSAKRGENASERAKPILRTLTEVLNETSGYFEMRGDYVECLATETSNQSLNYKMDIGERVRLYGNSSGKAILAAMSDPDLRRYLQTVRFVPYTDLTLGTAKKVREEVARIRANGISKSVGEYLNGITAFAVAVRTNGRPIGAFSVAVPDSRYHAALEEKIVAQLMSAKRRFEDQ